MILELPFAGKPRDREPDRTETIEAVRGERCDDVLFRLAVDERGPQALGALESSAAWTATTVSASARARANRSRS